MKIYIIDSSKEKLSYLESYFNGCEEVQCVCEDLHAFLSNNLVECVVSPANSFGIMDGGYDLAITEYFGDQLQERVQDFILNNFYGEQPVGTSFIIDAGKDNRTLIHTPTMRTPQKIKDPLVVYQCMRSTLMCALRNNVQSILIPMFGGGCGGVHPEVISEMMWRAYCQISNPPERIDWKYVEQHEIPYN